MKMKKTQMFILILLVVFTVLLGACGRTTNDTGEELDGDALITQIVLTAWAGGTQTAMANPATPTFTPTIMPTDTPMPTLASPTIAATTPTATLAYQQGTGSTGNTSASSCDSASFVSDVTIPDGTQIEPKKDFTKTWELKNIGTCTWNAAYQIVFFGGEQMGAGATNALTGSEVAPGESVQVSIDMTAPTDDGEYYSYWILRNANGQNFYIDGDSVYVQIKVGKSATNTPGPTATTAPANTDPTISVSASTTTADTATEITFTATVSDAEDGTASLEVTWDFGDGGTGTGATAGHTFTTDGSYTVTGTVKDSGGKTATATVDVTITAAP